VALSPRLFRPSQYLGIERGGAPCQLCPTISSISGDVVDFPFLMLAITPTACVERAAGRGGRPRRAGMPLIAAPAAPRALALCGWASTPAEMQIAQRAFVFAFKRLCLIIRFDLLS
jgi:hypothetical protein